MNHSIPYFGEEHNKIAKTITDQEAVLKHNYETVYQMIKDNLVNTVFVIDNKWFSWVKDVRFNYRDREAKLPYYEYELYDIPVSKKYTDNRGHIIVEERAISSEDGPSAEASVLTEKIARIRYNFDMKFVDIKPNTDYVMYNLKTQQKFICTAESWYEAEFDIVKLYHTYLLSSYTDFDELLEKHDDGKHYITRQFKGFINNERLKRKELELPTFKENQPKLEEYRDVRQYKREELFGITPLDNIIPYKIRRVLFEAMLYCIIQEGAWSTNTEFNRRYIKLQKEKCILSYREGYAQPPLILKSYWFGQGTYQDKRSIKKHI